MKTKIAVFALIVATAGAYVWTRPHSSIPSDMRDAVADNGEFNTGIPAFEKGGGNAPEPKAAAVESPAKGYIEPVGPATPIEWVPIPGGKFTMGTTSIEQGFEDAKPAHEVAIKTFEMSKTDVTVAQYAECVLKGGCTEPDTAGWCNWGKPGRGNYPMNCVDWGQADQYAKFKGARLPSEAEWEYAATSGGRNQKYPWGNEEPTCEKVVMLGHGGSGCDGKGTMPVCSRPSGNTAQGLCDMAGNVWQWVQDKYQDSYEGAPVDGSAFEGARDSLQVIRGGSYNRSTISRLRADHRLNSPDGRFGFVGFRLARSR